jgi:hypothetical protein
MVVDGLYAERIKRLANIIIAAKGQNAVTGAMRDDVDIGLRNRFVRAQSAFGPGSISFGSERLFNPTWRAHVASVA